MEPARLRRLAWRCRRGLLETDLLLQRFAAHGLEALTDAQVGDLARLLDYPDQELLAWLLGREAPPDQGLADVVARIRAAAG